MYQRVETAYCHALTNTRTVEGAWEAANEKARHLGWVKSCDELHEAVKRAGSAP